MQDEDQNESFTPTPLGSLFEAEDSTPTPEPVAEEQVQTEGQESTKDEGSTESTEDSTQTVDKDDSPTESDGPRNENTVPIAAIQAERAKSKALKAELEALRSQPTTTAEPVAKTSQLPSIYDGEEQYNGAVESLVDKSVKKAIFNDRLAIDQVRVVKEHGEAEVQAIIDKMGPELMKNPSFMQRYQNSHEPLAELIAMSGELEIMNNMNDPKFVADWEAKKEKEIEARVVARLTGERQVEDDLDASIPDTLSGTNSQGSLRAGKTFTKKSLETLFNEE